MLGHTDTKMTEHYAKLLDRYTGEQMDALSSIYAEKEEDKEEWKLESKSDKEGKTILYLCI